MTTITRRFINLNRKLRNFNANCKIPSGNVVLLIKDCLTLKTVSQKIPMLLFKLAFKGWTLEWLFSSIFIICYWRSKTDNNTESGYSESRLLTKKGRATSLRPLDEFLIVMCRLRQGFPEDHLAQLFNVSASTVSRIFITWVNFMFFKFGEIKIWSSRKLIDTMPKSFKGTYKSTRVIINCTEVRCQMPSSLQLN